MSRNYKFKEPEGVYFVSFAVIDWIDVFTRNKYKNIILDSLTYCQREKGMEIFAWCIMSNHVHLVFRCINGFEPQLVLGDFKRFTSKAIEQFSKAGAQTSNVNKYQFWRHDNKPIQLWSNKVIDEKIRYIHNNPVEEGLVFRPEDYIYSSAKDYSGGPGAKVF